MNLLLFESSEVLESTGAELRVRLEDSRRLTHLRQVLRLAPGDSLRVGLLDGAMGRARVLELTAGSALLAATLDEPPPPPLPLTLVLALPRPLVVRRLLADVTSFGVKRLCLVQTARVEKSYWSSPVLQPDEVRQALVKGLEQARDTRLPAVSLYPDSRAFLNEELPGLLQGCARGLFADPSAATGLGAGMAGSLLAVGPEGGFVPAELRRFESLGMQGIGLGTRILRVETAVTALLGALAASTSL